MEQEIDIQQLTKKERRELRRQERATEIEKMKSRRRIKRSALWGGSIFGIVLVVAGLIFVVMKGSGVSQDNGVTTSGLSSGDWIKGNPNASVVLIEYGDFQCPACASFYPTVKTLVEEFKESVAFSYRHFPLSQIHKNAELAGRITEAAGLQGKFWEMHDTLFERQKEWSNERDAKEIFLRYAVDLGLDMERFKTDLESDTVKSAVDEDYNEGIRARVNGTPTFFLNGSRISNPANYDEFRTIIQNKINERTNKNL